MNLENPTLPVKIIMWLPWCTLVLTAVFLARLPWWGVLLVAGFGWHDFLKTTVVWVIATPWTERTWVSALLVGRCCYARFNSCQESGIARLGFKLNQYRNFRTLTVADCNAENGGVGRGRAERSTPTLSIAIR